jgi:hypothetical protein
MYLDNDICNFELLFPLDVTKKKNILSTCFFRMSKHYKNLNTYINGLKRIIKIVDQQNNYTLRIFIDENIKNDPEIFKLLQSSSKVEIVIFKCSEYMNEQYHFDLFGTLVRLFPCFDFPNNDADRVIVIDIDLHIDDSRRLEALMKYNSSEKEIISSGSLDNLILEKTKPHIISNLTGYLNFKFDHTIITDFIKNAHNIKDVGQYDKRLTPFGFGVDELFITKYLLYKDNSKYLKDIKIGVLFEYTFNWFLYHYKKILMQQKYKINTYNNLKFILGKFYKSDFNLNKCFEVIDKYMYNQDSIDKYLDEKEYLSSRYYQLLHTLKRDNKLFYPDKDIMKILEQFNNINYSVSVLFYEPKVSPTKIISVKHLIKNCLKHKKSNNTKKTKTVKTIKSKKTKKH